MLTVEVHAKIVGFRRPITAALHAPFYNHASAGGATHPSINVIFYGLNCTNSSTFALHYQGYMLQRPHA